MEQHALERLWGEYNIPRNVTDLYIKICNITLVDITSDRRHQMTPSIKL